MIYVVQAGNTLAGIAVEYGISGELLALENGLAATSPLVVGQALLVLLPTQTLTVQAGDTIYAIAAQYGISVPELYRLNPWLNGMPDVWPGQTLVLEYADQQARSRIVTGYAYTFTPGSLLRQNAPYLSALLPFSYGFTVNGALLPPADEEALAIAFAQGAEALLVLTPLTESGSFSNTLINSVLNDAAAQANLIDQLLSTVRDKGYAGVDLDFEYIRAEDSDAYINFADTLAQRLRAEGYILTLALAPKYFAEQQGLLYEGHDYAALGAVTDLALMMTYEWGYTYGPPQAVAPLPQVRQVVEYGLSEIPAQKLLLGVPNYGYDWTLPYEQGRAARSISPVQAVELALEYGAIIQYDNVARSPWFEYITPEGVRHVVWFEDVRSLTARLQLIEEYNLAGLGFWTVSRPFPAGFLLLANNIVPQPLS